MCKMMSWADLLGYSRTWSALHTFSERNPTDGAHTEGSIEVRFWNALKEGARRATGEPVPDKAEVKWPVAMVLARKVV